MNIIEKIMSWFGGNTIPPANVVEELLPKEIKEKKPKAKLKAKSKAKVKKEPAKKAGHTKASLSKMTKAQLVTLATTEFNIKLDKNKTKAILVNKLLGIIKKTGR